MLSQCRRDRSRQRSEMEQWTFAMQLCGGQHGSEARIGQGGSSPSGFFIDRRSQEFVSRP